MTTNKYCMGIDPSVNGTAICIIDMDTRKVKYQHRIITVLKKGLDPKDLNNRSKQLYHINNEIMNTLEQYTPRVICLENFSYQSRNSLPLQGMVVGSIMLAINTYYRRPEVIRYMMGKPIVKYPSPQSVKMFCANKMSAKKDLMLMRIYKRWKQEYEDDNEADAFILSQIARCIKVLNDKFDGIFEYNTIIPFSKKYYDKKIKEIIHLDFTKNEIERVLRIENRIKLLKVRK